jgi:hypothetical protein
MSDGWIKVHTREADVTRQVGTIRPFGREFYDQLSRDTTEITLWGLHVKLDWKGGYDKVVGILVDPGDVPKLRAVGFEPV